MEEEEWLKIGVAATLARSYAADQREFLESLARMLEQALPGHVEVRRGGGLLSRRRPVRQVQVELEDYRYALEDPGQGALRARRTRISRGIALSTEQLPVEAWIQALGDALQGHAERNGAAAGALRRLLE